MISGRIIRSFTEEQSRRKVSLKDTESFFSSWARRGVGLHVGEEAEREDGDHAHEGEDDEQDGVVVGEVLDDTADQRSGEAAELENGEEDAIEGRGRFGKAYGECNSTRTLLDEVRESQTAQRPRYTPWAFQSIAAPTPTARLAIT